MNCNSLNRLMARGASFSQSITQLSSQSSTNIGDDLLQSDKMTIIDVVESINVC